MVAKSDEGKLFRSGKAQWLQKAGQCDLDDDQRALLLALTQLEASLGHELSSEESEAMETLSGGMEGFDAQEIKQAIQRVVDTPADPRRTTSWSELKRREE
ncbi:MAG: hypothetical protein ACLFU8_00455 [Anaerolineales bacterium]